MNMHHCVNFKEMLKYSFLFYDLYLIWGL